MKISEMIAILANIMATEGDLRVTVFDEYTASEGWGYHNEDLWENAVAQVATVVDDDDNELEKVVQIS